MRLIGSEASGLCLKGSERFHCLPHPWRTDRQTHTYSWYAHTVVMGLLECDQNQRYLILPLPVPTHVMGQVLLSPLVEA